MMDAIAVRQIASTSKAGAADAGELLADSIENMINREKKGIGEFPFLPSEVNNCSTLQQRVRRSPAFERERNVVQSAILGIGLDLKSQFAAHFKAISRA
jgi:hypothetical protein